MVSIDDKMCSPELSLLLNDNNVSILLYVLLIVSTYLVQIVYSLSKLVYHYLRVLLILIIIILTG